MSIALSLGPGVHASSTLPEQVGDSKTAVRETGGEGAARRNRIFLLIQE